MRKGLSGLLAALLLNGQAQAEESTPPPAAHLEAPQQEVHFDIWAFRVDGNTVLPDEALERTVYPYTGPGRAIADVEEARKALEKLYHDKGYTTVLVDIPEQDVNEGLVILDVTEGKVGRLNITGSRYYSLGKIREGVPALAEGQVPHMPTVQKQLAALAEQTPDRNVTPVLRAGQTPGKLDVELQVKDELPLHGGVEMNTRNSEGTTLTRLIGSIRYDNLWQLQHSASLQYQVSPENYDQVEVWSGTYAMPLGFWDSRLAFYGVGISSNTDIATAGAMSVVGTGEIYGLRLVKPFGSDESLFHSVTLGWDYKDFGQSIVATGADTQATPIHYAPFMLGYNLIHRGEGRMSSMDLGMHFSIRGLGNDSQEFANKRYNAKPDYLYFTAELKHQETLPYDIRLLMRVDGQISDMPLISNEQFSAGGPLSVRGYHQTEVLGDDGITGSLELYSPTLVESEYVQELRLLTFVEGARLWILEALPGSPSGYHLASTGAGFRMRAFNRFSNELDWSYPFVAVNNVHVGEQRIDFRVSYEF